MTGTHSMAKRTKPPVSLAKIGGREATAIAESALRKFKTTGWRAGQAPTAERLLRAGGNASIQTFAEIAEISKGDKFEAVPVDMTRIVLTDDPFSSLCKRKLLAPGDPSLNMILCHAGLRYRQAWRTAGFENLKSIEFGRVGSSSSSGMFASEASAAAFQLYAKIKNSMPSDYHSGVDGIVLNDRDPVDIGRQISAYKAPKQAVAVALFVLRRGLESGARALGLLSPVPTHGMESPDIEAKEIPEGA